MARRKSASGADKCTRKRAAALLLVGFEFAFAGEVGEIRAFAGDLKHALLVGVATCVLMPST